MCCRKELLAKLQPIQGKRKLLAGALSSAHSESACQSWGSGQEVSEQVKISIVEESNIIKVDT